VRPPEIAVTALSPVATATSFCRIAGALWATIVVKATFHLVHGESARAVAPEQLVREDRMNGVHGSLERACETAAHLPNAGVVLSGRAFAPTGRAVASASVRLGISRDRPLIDKTLHVFGDRTLAAPRIVAPFQTMPLTYERAYGGPGIAANPAGTGGPGSAALPNIVDPKHPHEVAGFGPIAPGWAPRPSYLGSLSPAAVSSPVFDVPAGFDWRFFQAAPLDQQLDQIRGDEWIVLDGMHPALARVHSRLPHVTAAARRAATGQAVEMRADMLVIDADRLIASVIWRGRFQVDSSEAARGERVQVGLERPGHPLHWPSEGLPTTALPVLVADRPSASPVAFTTETTELDVRAILGARLPFAPEAESPAARPKVDVRGTMEGIAVAGPSLPFAPVNSSKPPVEAVATPLSVKEPPGTTGTAEVDVAKLLAAAMPYKDSRSPEPPPVPAPPPVLPVTPPQPPRMPAPQPVPPVTPPETLPPVSVSVAAPSTSVGGPASPALSRKEVDAILAQGGRLDGANLAGANLSGLDLSGPSLVRTSLQGAKLRGTNLSGAKLAHATLEGADLRGALLEGADLSSATLTGANLEKARLGRCTAAKASFRDASLVDADLGGGLFAGAFFTGASMRGVCAERTDFAEARLERADLSFAHLAGASLPSADLADANLERADFR
jgi:uncharacterized protein YjbI with pentapeptide repeats